MESLTLKEQIEGIQEVINTGSGEVYVSERDIELFKCVLVSLQKLRRKEILIELIRDAEDMGLYDKDENIK